MASRPTIENIAVSHPSFAQLRAMLQTTPPGHERTVTGLDVPGCSRSMTRALRSTTTPPAHATTSAVRAIISFGAARVVFEADFETLRAQVGRCDAKWNLRQRQESLSW